MDTPLHLLAGARPHAEAEAFGDLVREHGGMVFATARRITCNDALAQDVAQETFLELARGRHGAVRCVAAWLHRVAWRKACNAIRGESRRRRHEQAAAAVLHDTAEATWAELEPLIDEALEQLPAHLRGLLVSHYLEGRTQQEVALRMGVCQSTVSRQLETALHELRSRLRVRGVLTGTGLALLLATHAAEAAPPALTLALGKLTLGHASATTTATKALSSTLVAMTSTTKVLLTTAAVAAIAIPVTLHRAPSARPPKRHIAPVAAAPQMEGEKTAPTPEVKRYRPAPVSPQVRQKVEGILQRHRGMTMEQFMQSEQILDLMRRVNKMMETHDFSKLEQSMADLKSVTGVEHGNMSIAFQAIDDAASRALLEAAVSEDAELMEAWLVNRVEGAIFEFAIDPSLERTSDGVTITPDKRSSVDTPQDQD